MSVWQKSVGTGCFYVAMHNLCAGKLLMPVTLDEDVLNVYGKYGSLPGNEIVTGYKPFTEAHAIASVEIAIILDTSITHEDGASLKQALAPLISEEDYSSGGEPVDNEGSLAFVMMRNDVAGDLTEQLFLGGKIFGLRSLDYRGWTFTRDAAARRASFFFDWCAANGRKIDSFGLKLTDKFIYEGPIQDFDINRVLNSGSKYLPRAAIEANAFWKTRIAWFEECQSDVHSYNVIECSVGSGDKTDEDEHSVEYVAEVAHRQRTHRPEDVFDSTEFSEVLDLMYVQNKKVVGSLLNEDMLGRIGLKEAL